MNCYFAALDNEALLHVKGPDTLTFLQGQLTCDTRQLGERRALPGLYCTPQGRVACDFLLLQLAPQHAVLRLRRDLREASAALLAKYAVFSKTEIQADREDRQLYACWGPGAAEALRAAFGAAPGEQYETVSGDDALLVQVDASGEQFECLLGPGREDRLASRATAVAADSWEALQIRAGRARITAATSGEFIPQMLNYDLTGHISFNKGCYTGQEVVARMHYRGKPKRRLYLAGLDGRAAATSAQALLAAPLYSGDGEQSVGTVINCAPDDSAEAGGRLLLVTATAAGVEAGLRLGAPDGPLLRPGTLPYALPQ